MINLKKIRRALISVSDKTRIVELSKILEKYKIEIISTGGTYKLLKNNGVDVKEVSEFTSFPEIMDGRVKTLHPKIHGSLLAIEDNKIHLEQAKKSKIDFIDLVVVNLYPFLKSIKDSSNDHNKIIENIDIGGPSMIRSAAKNYIYKTVITDPDQYDIFFKELEDYNGSTRIEYRKNQSRIAFNVTANYDQLIANYFNIEQRIQLPEKLNFPHTIKNILRYGENSHQRAALYQDDMNHEFGITNAIKIQGKDLSYNNLNDADTALKLVSEFTNPAVAIIKHLNPCGVATSDDINSAYIKALSCDPRSAFGGIVALNKSVDEKLALELTKIFYEIIIAPNFTKEAIEIFKRKKRLRVLQANYKRSDNLELRTISGGILVQSANDGEINKNSIKLVTGSQTNENLIEELIFSLKICKYAKSNAIVISHGFQSIGLGLGQTSRIDSVSIACKKAKKFHFGNIKKLEESVIASDAFFPFEDNIEIIKNYGISNIITPNGSISDEKIISKCKEFGLRLYFTDKRYFSH